MTGCGAEVWTCNQLTKLFFCESQKNVCGAPLSVGSTRAILKSRPALFASKVDDDILLVHVQ